MSATGRQMGWSERLGEDLILCHAIMRYRTHKLEKSAWTLIGRLTWSVCSKGRAGA